MGKGFLKGSKLKGAKKEMKRMRKILLFVTAFLLTAFLAVPGYTLQIFPVTDFKFTGHTALNDIDNSGGPSLGDTIWSIGNITGTVNPATGIPYPVEPGVEYTYMIYGVPAVGGDTKLNLLVPGFPPPNQSFEFGGNPVTYIAVYRDTTPDYNGGGPGPGARIGVDDYPTVTDGTPFMTGILAPYYISFVNGLPVVLAGSINLLTITGGETAYINLMTIPDFNAGGFITGSFNSQVIPGYFGIGPTGLSLDVQILNTIQPPMVAGWYNRDNDPATAAIPEPSTFLLLGSALIGLGGFACSRKFK